MTRKASNKAAFYTKKVLVLSSSPRKNGNSDMLCDEFIKGAKESGNAVEKIRVAAKNITACLGCYYCKSHNGDCIHKDDMKEIMNKIIEADVIIMASPVYFYSINSNLKALIDRTVCRWLEVKDKEFYYIVTMADEEPATADTALSCLRGYADCVEGAKEKGVIIGSGLYEPGTVKDTVIMKEAYEKGLNI